LIRNSIPKLDTVTSDTISNHNDLHKLDTVATDNTLNHIDMPKLDTVNSDNTLNRNDIPKLDKNNQSKRPIQVFPLLKELGAGWGNMKIPTLLNKDAKGTHSLVVNCGLDAGDEFFYAIDRGFEVVGFEVNPVSFKTLASKCAMMGDEKCIVINDINSISLPLKRKPNSSYLIFAGVGSKKGKLQLYVNGPISTLAPIDAGNKATLVEVPIVRIDDVIMEDVYLLMIDVQGFEYSALQGASNIFKNFVVRQLIFEVDSKLNSALGNDFMTMLRLVYWEYGMTCFTVRNDFKAPNNHDNSFGAHAERAESLYNDVFKSRWVNDSVKDKNQFWSIFDDFLCINTEKSYDGPVLPIS